MEEERALDVLGVAADAAPEEIHMAYRRMSMLHHPDKIGGNTERYLLIRAAYDFLAGREKRTRRRAESPPPPPSPVSSSPAPAPAPAPAKNGPMMLPLSVPIEAIFSRSMVPAVIHRACGETEKIYVTVPQGVDSGEFLTVRGKGEKAASGAGYGDITFVVEIVNNTPFRRAGMDLVYTLDIGLKEALLGFERTITHVDGRPLAITSTLPVAPGHRKVVPGMGILRNDVVGDLHVDIRIHFPTQLSPQAKLALQDGLT